MFAATHKLIAIKITEIIKSELDIELDIKGLKSGSVAPDLHPSMMFMKHTKIDADRLVNENINRMIKGGFSKNKKDIKEFSFRMGIVLHFICDYFCMAHNDAKFNNMILHLKYESRLKKFFEKHIDEHIPSKFTTDFITSDFFDSIRSFIDEKYLEYNTIKRSMINDVKYSLEVSIMAALAIVSICTGKYSKGLVVNVA